MNNSTLQIDKLRHIIAETDSEAFFSISPPTNQYLTGFLTSFIEVSSAVIVTPDQAVFLCDSRYTEQAMEQVEGFCVEEIDMHLAESSGKRLNELSMKRVGFDPSSLTVQEFYELEKAFEGELIPLSHVTVELRKIKSDREIELIRQASQLAEGVYADLIETVEPPITEMELAASFEYEFRKRGASGASFDIIALFGSRSSLCHGIPGSRVLEDGDIILLDFGCRRSGYCSDLTRTCVYGTIHNTWFTEIYDIVLSAQEAALEAIRPGISCRQLDSIARSIISDAGYGDYFGHGLGHGVGIEIHESPRANRHSDDVIESGMIVTVEPGIYLPGKGGVRIEDLVVVTEGGCDILSKTPKNLRILEK